MSDSSDSKSPPSASRAEQERSSGRRIVLFFDGTGAAAFLDNVRSSGVLFYSLLQLITQLFFAWGTGDEPPYALLARLSPAAGAAAVLPSGDRDADRPVDGLSGVPEPRSCSPRRHSR